MDLVKYSTTVRFPGPDDPEPPTPPGGGGN